MDVFRFDGSTGFRGQRSLRVEEEVDTLSRFTGYGHDFVPVLFTESGDVSVESPLHATFGVGAELVGVRHDARVGWRGVGSNGR